jgi:hypothetical protein
MTSAGCKGIKSCITRLCFDLMNHGFWYPIPHAKGQKTTRKDHGF